jgi:protein O-GlcNAc transferase
MNHSKTIQSALKYFQSGNLKQAKSICETILKNEPNNVSVLHFLGIIYYQLEDYNSAVIYIEKALQIDPNSFEGFYNLGRAFYKIKFLTKAINCYKKSLRLNPAFPDAHINLANTLRDIGKIDEAIDCYQKIIALNPKNAGIFFNLGVAYQEKKQFDEAIDCYQKALALNFKISGIYNNLGLSLQNKELLDEAIVSFKKSLELDPHCSEANYNLGNALKAQGYIDEAISFYKKAIQSNPNYFDAYNNIGVALKDKGQIDQAIACYKKALQLNPNSAESYNNIGIAFYHLGDFQNAISCFKKALTIDANFALAYNALGTVLKDTGQHDKSETHLKHALQIKTDFSIAYSNLLLYMNYNPKYSPQDIYFEHLRFAKQIAEPLSSAILPHTNNPSTSRRLKIGYVSPDFRRHSVEYFIEPFLISHDHYSFEVYCYSDVIYPDKVTERLQQYSDQWRIIIGMSDEKAAELIRKDSIDILVDLAGHTSNNRILLFARKPAPVQVNWIGYPATTGLSTMDYKIVDSYTDPPGMTEQFYIEKLIRMPETFLCYLPERCSPDIAALPALTSGHITFGSFNNFAKVSPEVLELWTKILQPIPDSHLIMKAKSLSDRSTREYVAELFSLKGISARRIELLSWEPSARGHLENYNRIDIALDTFPYNGTTTTCEALWMGVPVITLAGKSHASRVGVSLLSNVGISELIAETPDKYIEIAGNLSKDLNRLQSLRNRLRDMMAHSPLTDSKRFTENLENAYRDIWEKWCKSF